MSQRFYIYPLLCGVAVQLAQFLRTNPRWYRAQVAQLLVILLVSAAAMYFSHNFVWVIVAWSLFAVFVLVPQFLARTATRRQMTRPPNEVTRWWRLAGWFAWGNVGRVYQAYAAALRLWGSGHRLAAEKLLDEFAARPIPEPIRGEIAVWKLSLLVATRDFSAAVACYEEAHDWGSLTSDTLARLLAARAYAESGEPERAVWCLQFVALSPRTIGAMERQLWATRVCVAALAGDEPELESLLRWREQPLKRGREFARFAAYWRGRCALARGDRPTAISQLDRARGLTHPRNELWRAAIALNLELAKGSEVPSRGAAALAKGSEVVGRVPSRGAAVPAKGSEVVGRVPPRGAAAPATTPADGGGPTMFAAQRPGYAAEQRALHLAEEQAAGWRALMHLGSPGRVTQVLLVMLAGVFLTDTILFEAIWQHPLWIWAGNVPEAVRHGEWWRSITALFLHAGPLHLAMNGLALWLFGSAVEKSIGRWRYLVVFLVAGSLGNLASAMTGRYDVSVGASGGIFGVIAAFAVAAYRLESPLYASARRRLLWLLAAMVAVDLTISGLEPQVDNLAHAGGFVTGLVLALLLYPRRGRRLTFARNGG